MYFKNIFLFIGTLSLLGCSYNNDIDPLVGKWTGYMMLNKTDAIHINFNLENKQDSLCIKIKLDKDTFTIRDIVLNRDSLIFKLPLYDSEFKLKIVSNNHVEGSWYNYNKAIGYKIPFMAIKDTIQSTELPIAFDEVYKRYKIIFNENTADEYNAIGLFKQRGTIITGTFATETGDYRALEGVVINNEISLNGFDGAHAFLFKAQVKNDSLLNGVFLSGIHSKETFKGNRNQSFELTNADSITTSINEEEFIDFKLPNANGDTMTWSKMNLNSKVIIIQIMGSWCPNCYDETVLLTEYYKKYKSKGLVIIPIAFEATDDYKTAVKRLNKMYTNIGVNYDYLIGGINDKKIASQLFPTLSELKSFPTTIFIDKHRKTRKIHSGFYGPETGNYYNIFKADTDRYIKSLLEEN